MGASGLHLNQWTMGGVDFRLHNGCNNSVARGLTSCDDFRYLEQLHRLEIAIGQLSISLERLAAPFDSRIQQDCKLGNRSS